MSWLSDASSKFIRESGKAWQKGTSLGGLVNNDVSDFFEREIVNKADLRGAEAVSFASGLSGIGDIVRGIEGVNQMEDLYNNTGKVAHYPGASGSGASSLGHALSDLPNKIADGSHDLYEFYTGASDGMFTQMSDGWNKYQQSYTKPQTR